MLSSLLLYSALVATALSASIDREVERHHVIVVGAGVSGFTATATLLEHNVTDVLILEASDRIGGRIHTVQFGGVPIDKGAEYVHGEVDNAVYEMVAPYNLLHSYQTIVGENSFIFANTSGHVFNSSLLKEVLDKSFEIAQDEAASKFDGSVGDFLYPRLEEILKAKDLDSYMHEALHHLVPLLEGVYSGCDNLTELGAKGNTEYWENEGDLVLKWKTGGYKTVFDFISKKFPNPTEELPVKNKTVFEKQVTKIDQTEKGLEVTCADGSIYIADHVIFTPSLGVLKKHSATIFHPPLPADKTAAIQALGFGCVAKIFMLFPTRWWPKDISEIIPLFSRQERQDFENNSVHGSWTSYTTGYHSVMNHDQMLCAWFAGQACRTMESLTEDQVIDGLMELLNKIVGNTYDIPKPESILRTSWASNPYVLGAYSYRTVKSDYKNLTSSHLAQPILDDKGKPVILFAGEATHPHYFSTVHGALDSGRREAHNILNYLNITHS